MAFLTSGERNTRMSLFRKPANFDAFVPVLPEGLERKAVDLLAWCWMTNHWCLGMGEGSPVGRMRQICPSGGI